MAKNTANPAVLISLAIVISFGVICISHVLTNNPLSFINYIDSYGKDLADFYNASVRLIHGESPYSALDHRYVTTPIPAILNVVFIPLGFDGARILFYFLIPISLLVSYFLVTSAYPFKDMDKRVILLAGLMCLLFSYPFYFLLERENIDGWVLLFLSLGFFLSMKPRFEILIGLFFSLAIAFKIYPILILIPLLFARKWRVLFWTFLWLIVWSAITFFWFSDFLIALTFRTQLLFRLDENGSLVATIAFFFSLIKAFIPSIPDTLLKISPIITALIYGLLLSLLIFADYRKWKIHQFNFRSLPLYFPFMIALPQVVYHYSLIICLALIPTICYLWEARENRVQGVLLLIICIGIVMSQWQAIATHLLTGNQLSEAIPGSGLFIVMVTTVVYKINSLRPVMVVVRMRNTTESGIIQAQP